MSYEDPQSGRERNLGQEEAGNSLISTFIGVIFVAAIVLGGWYFYSQSQRVANNTANQPATAAQNSGPGVEGAAGSKNGPTANESSSTGASTGNTGVGGEHPNIDRSTVPSQDATGVKGAEGGKNGPTADTPPSTNTPANNPTPQPSTNP